MYRLFAFVLVVAAVRFVVDAPLRDAFSSTVKSSSMLLPALNLAAPDSIFYGVAGLAMPLILVGSNMRFSKALLVGVAIVVAAQVFTMFILGSVTVTDWRGYIVVFGPIFIPVVAFALGAGISFTLIQSFRRKTAS